MKKKPQKKQEDKDKKRAFWWWLWILLLFIIGIFIAFWRYLFPKATPTTPVLSASSVTPSPITSSTGGGGGIGVEPTGEFSDEFSTEFA